MNVTCKYWAQDTDSVQLQFEDASKLRTFGLNSLLLVTRGAHWSTSLFSFCHHIFRQHYRSLLQQFIMTSVLLQSLEKHVFLIVGKRCQNRPNSIVRILFTSLVSPTLSRRLNRPSLLKLRRSSKLCWSLAALGSVV